MLASSHCLAKTFADSNLPFIINWGVVKGCHINPTWIAASGGNNIIVWLLTPSLYLILKGMLWLYYPHILPSSPLSVFQLHQFESVWGVNCWVCQMWSLLCRIKHYRLKGKNQLQYLQMLLLSPSKLKVLPQWSCIWV